MIVSNKHPAIAKEGWLYIGVLLALSAAGLYLQTMTLFVVLFCLTLLLFYIFRDPIRIIPSIPLGIVSPIDGKILSIEEVENKDLNESFQRLVIQNNKLGVFAIRSPIEGKLFKQFAIKKSRDFRYINWVQTDEGDNILWEVGVRTSSNAHCYVQPGERIGQGQRCGFLALNSHVNVYIPLKASIAVKVSDNVLAGESIIAQLVHNNGASITAKVLETAPKT